MLHQTSQLHLSLLNRVNLQVLISARDPDRLADHLSKRKDAVQTFQQK